MICRPFFCCDITNDIECVIDEFIFFDDVVQGA